MLSNKIGKKYFAYGNVQTVLELTLISFPVDSKPDE